MIFIDTGAFIARYLSHDKHHNKALKLWQALEKESTKLFTSSFVLDETFTLLARKSYYKFAAEKAKIIYHSNIITILRSNHDIELAAINYFNK